MGVKTIEGNTSSTKGLIANGGAVREKEYTNSYSKIAAIYRPKYKLGEASKLVSIAKTYVGYLEKKSNANLENFTANAGYNNYTMFAEHARKVTGSTVYVNGQPWCDYFVDDMFIRSFGKDRAKQLLGGWSGYTPTSANLLQKAGAEKVAPSEAQYGDIIFFKNSTRICHTGIVTNNYKVSSASDKNFKYDQLSFISEVCKTLKVSDAKSAFSKTVTLSEKKNPKHALVLCVQKRLKDLGYYEGTPDREFGPLTTKAVNAYQTKVLGYAKTDGEITKKGKMWKSLLGLK